MPQQPFTNIYDNEYFSSSSTFLYIGDVWVDEVTSLSYTTQQQKTPIYGYASQLWDDCAAGHVLVQGEFTINFKEQGYLWAVLRRYFDIHESGAGLVLDDKQAKKSARRDKRLQRAKIGKKRVSGGTPVTGSNQTRVSRASIERIVQGEATRGDRYSFYNGLAGYSTFDIDSPKDKIFEDIVEVFEDQVWTTSDEELNSQIRRTDDNAFDGFDIYVLWGNYAVKGANHSVQRIMDVRLMSQGKVIQMDGVPISESYSFIARSVA